MKRLLSILLSIIILGSFSNSFAERIDFSKFSNEDLQRIITDAKQELENRNKTNISSELKPLKEMFECENVAIYVRDHIGLISIDQTPTEEQLLKVTSLISSSDKPFTSLKGISCLKNLLDFTGSSKDTYTIIPDEFYSLSKIEFIHMPYTKINEISPLIGNLSNLESLNLSDTQISSLPEEIGNLTKLRYLNISRTKITELPSSIYNLNLEKFIRDGLELNIN